MNYYNSKREIRKILFMHIYVVATKCVTR